MQKKTYHELWCRCTFRKALLDERVREDDLRQLDCEVILIGSAILCDGRTNGNWRYGDVLPEELLWPAELWPQAQQLAVLHLVSSSLRSLMVLRTSSDILLNKSSTFNGFKSSFTALFRNCASSFCASIALAKVRFHLSISSAVFFERNLS